ncbi:hypothetical protein AmDm5_0762 [Acetobacter malorum]|nr:hypothetical protein AmDm5_0762 [Acetobacter malorum]
MKCGMMSGDRILASRFCSFFFMRGTACHAEAQHCKAST